MKVFYNSIIPFKGFVAINLFGAIFAREEHRPISVTTIRHEAIHSAQMRELLFVGFYFAYLAEWFFFLLRKRRTGENAYRNISFEKEAYSNEKDAEYLSRRERFAQWRARYD